MSTFQVTRRELVYVDRTYEVEAENADAAACVVEADGGNLVDEQMQETYDVRPITAVYDMNGNQLIGD